MKENLLENIIIEIIAKSPQTKAQFDSARRQVAGKLKMKQPSNPDLLKAYQKMLKNKRKSSYQMANDFDYF